MARLHAVHTTDWNTAANRMRRVAAPGKPSGLSRGAWVSDLASLRKAIMLCGFCAPKWNAKAHHYVPRSIVRTHPFVISDCDGCGSINAPCKLYRHEEVR